MKTISTPDMGSIEADYIRGASYEEAEELTGYLDEHLNGGLSGSTLGLIIDEVQDEIIRTFPARLAVEDDSFDALTDSIYSTASKLARTPTMYVFASRVYCNHVTK